MTGKVGMGIWVKTLSLDSTESPLTQRRLLSTLAALAHVKYWLQVNILIILKSVGIRCKNSENVTTLRLLSFMDN